MSVPASTNAKRTNESELDWCITLVRGLLHLLGGLVQLTEYDEAALEVGDLTGQEVRKCPNCAKYMHLPSFILCFHSD